MMLARTYGEDDYAEALMVVRITYNERQWKIVPEMKLDAARSKYKGKGTEISIPESSTHRGDLKKSYDKGQKKTRFSETTMYKDQDERKGTHLNMEEPI
jgi:hypothetical protein